MACLSAFPSTRTSGRRFRSNRPLLTVEGEGSCATLFSHAGVRRAHLARHGDSIEALNAFARDAIAADRRSRTRRKMAPTSEAPSAPPSGRWTSSTSSRRCGPGSGALTGAKRRAWRWRRAPSWTRSCDWSARGARVVGHTVQPGGMTTRCAGRLHLIDVGVSDAYIGRGAAWSCEEGTTRAHYDGKTVILDESADESADDDDGETLENASKRRRRAEAVGSDVRERRRKPTRRRGRRICSVGAFRSRHTRGRLSLRDASCRDGVSI